MSALDSLKGITLSWFDLFAAAMIVIGLFVGRKRGMSLELLDVLAWLMVIEFAKDYYPVVTNILMAYVPFSIMAINMISYVLVIVLIMIGFVIIKKMVGEKLVGSDLFGRMEYYLGMLSGMLRFFCIVVLVLALVNAKTITQEELEAEQAEREKKAATGDFSGFSWGSLQQELFGKSAVGRFVKQHLNEHLIAPVRYEPRVSPPEGLGRKIEKDVNELIDSNPTIKK